MNKIRSLVIEILCSFSLNEHLKHYCNDLMMALLTVIQTDNEENASISIKGSFELHKIYRPYLEKHVDPFIEFVNRLYNNVPSIVANTLRGDLSGGSTAGQQASSNNENSTNVSSGSTKRACAESLLVLTECPLIVMFLYQVYPNYLTPILSNLITLMIQTLGLSLPVSASNYHVRSKELLSVQVKTLSFVTYFLRPYSELIRPYETSIATSIYNMFIKCPEDAVSIRKELLVATRHIIATEFRKGLFVYLDEFLRENILFGPGKPVILRPLVYTTLADLIQHVRDILTVTQLIRIVDLYSTILQDTSLPSNMHGIAVRVLHYLVEKINQLKSGPHDKSNPAFSLNFIVFKALVDKIGALRYNIDKYGQVTTILNNESAYLIDGSSYLWFKKLANAADNATEIDDPLLKYQLPCDVTSKNIKELLKAIVCELHKLMPFVDNKSLFDASVTEKSAQTNGYDYFEKVRVIGKYLIWTLQCCQIYIRKSNGNSSASDSSSTASSQDIAELKEILTCLITSLSMLSSDTFRCVLKARIHSLCDIASNDQVYLLFFNQLFMNNPTLGLHLFDIMCSYFVSKVEIIPPIGSNSAVKTARSRLSISEDTKQYPFLLRILKNMLQSISKVVEYEKCLITRLPRLLTSLLRSSLVSPTCINQCNMLRLLFRSAPEFKLEQFINAITPYFNTIIHGLDALYHRTTLKSTKNIVVELCLTIPVNSKSQMAHLPVLLKYVAIALKEYNELAKIALKSLETWSDFQSGDNFMAVLNALPPNVLEDILHGIQRHLKPLPYSQGLLALKLLGKLGGHCKRFLDSIPYHNVNAFHFNNLKYSHSRIVELSSKIQSYNDDDNRSILADCNLDLLPLVQGACELLFTSIAPNDSDTESEVLTMNSVNTYNTSVTKSTNKIEMPSTLYKYLGEDVTRETKAMEVVQPTKVSNILTEWYLEDMTVTMSESEDSDGSRSLDIKTLNNETNYLSFSLFLKQKQDCCKFLYLILLNILAIPSNSVNSKASNIVAVDKSTSVSTRAWCNTDILQEIILTIFIALLDDNIKVVDAMNSGELIDGVLMHALVCSGSVSVADTGSGTESLYQVINNVIVLLITDKRREIRKQGFVVFNKWLHSIDRYENYSQQDNCNSLATSNLALDASKVVVRDLLEKVISLLISNRLNDRIIGCKCLCDMSKLFRANWCDSTTAAKVINALYGTLAHPTSSINLSLLYDVYETFHVFISSVSITEFAENLNTLQTIFSGCFHNNPTIRLVAILIISKLCEAVGKQELQLFGMMKAHIQVMITDELARMTTQSIIDPGFLYGLTYLFNFGFTDIDSTIISYLVLVLKQNELDQVPIEQVNGLRVDLQLADLMNVIGVSTGGKNAANIANFNKLVTICTTDIRVIMSIYPNLLPCNVMKHLSTIHFVESLYVASSAKSGKSIAEMDEINTKTCEFLLKSIISHGWNELSEAASRAIVSVNSKLAAVNCTKSYFEKHVVEDTCKAIFSAMQDIKTATRSLLSSFYALMRALPDVFSYDYYIQRFLNYLKVWSEPSKITSLNSFLPGSEQQVSLAIIMTLLSCNMTAPTVANPSKMVLDEFINTVIDIEQAHFRFLYAADNDSSPYSRLVYDAFLKYPNESMHILISQESMCKKRTVDFLLRFFKSNSHRLDKFITTFIARGLPVVKSINHAANVLIGDIVKDPTIFVMTDIDERTIDTAFNCSVLLRHMLKIVPDLILQAGDLVEILHHSLMRCVNMINSFMKHNYRPVYISRYYQEIKFITKSLIHYCKHFKKVSGVTDHFVPQYDILFELVHVLNMYMSSPVDYTYIAEFMRVTLPTLLDASQLKEIITKYFTEFNTNPRFVFDWKTKSLEVLIIPLLQHYYTERSSHMDDGSDIFDADLMKLVMSEGYNAYASDGTDASVATTSSSRNNDHDLLKVALLKLSTILLSHCHSLLRVYKKDLIKYPWNCIKAEDYLLKYWSYVSICYFVAAFDSPAKIIIQVYVALLKASSSEGKDIIRIAVDKLLPALSSRLYSDDMFKIIKWTKKILLEEGTNNLPLLTHIWGMISRHSETFYPYRHLLLPQIVTTLSKVGLASTNVPQDFRQMTLTLVDVIIGWEFYRIMKINTPVEAASNELKRDSTGVTESTDTANKKLKVDVDINIENPMSQPTSTSEGMTTASPRATALDNTFLANLPLLLANFVVRLAFKIIDTRVAGNNPKDVTTQKLYSRCMHLYKVTHAL